MRTILAAAIVVANVAVLFPASARAGQEPKKAEVRSGVVDLGSTTVESSIRRPETDVIEASDVLVRTAADLVKEQLLDLEKETLSKMEGRP